MKDDLGGGYDRQAAVGVHLAPGAEGLHHRLLAGLGVVGLLDDPAGPGERLFDVPLPAAAGGGEVAAVVRPDRAEAVPALLRMDEGGVVHRRVEVEDGREDFVVHLDQPQRLVCRLFGLGGDNRGRVADIAELPVEDQPVVGRRLGVGLPGEGKALLRHVFISIDRHHPRDLQGEVGPDRTDPRMGMGGAQQLDGEAAGGCQVVGIDRLPGRQSFPVLFAGAAAEVFFRHLLHLPFVLEIPDRRPDVGLIAGTAAEVPL